MCGHTNTHIYIYMPTYICIKGLGACQQQLTLHNRTNVYTRQLSFLPTIMREIESQEMFVFLSIRPNNNIILCRFKKPSVFKRQLRKKKQKKPKRTADAVFFFFFVTLVKDVKVQYCVHKAKYTIA